MGPIDYLVIELPANGVTGKGLPLLHAAARPDPPASPDRRTS
jgi:hypothetical protein